MSTTPYEYKSEFARGYFSKGQAEGEARSVLRVLSTRGFDVPAEVRERITSCTDLDQLEAWVGRAVTVGTLDELFD